MSKGTKLDEFDIQFLKSKLRDPIFNPIKNLAKQNLWNYTYSYLVGTVDHGIKSYLGDYLKNKLEEICKENGIPDDCTYDLAMIWVFLEIKSEGNGFCARVFESEYKDIIECGLRLGYIKKSDCQVPKLQNFDNIENFQVFEGSLTDLPPLETKFSITNIDETLKNAAVKALEFDDFLDQLASRAECIEVVDLEVSTATIGISGEESSSFSCDGGFTSDSALSN